MAYMPRTAGKATAPWEELPVAPSAEAWRAMSPAERERLLIRINEAFSDPVLLKSEGRPHKKAKSEAVDTLSLHFRTVGRVVYLAEEMSVLYPGQKPFSPDVLAVMGVPEPEDDERMAWVVADEGRGLDLVIEVLHRGDRNKDLVENVERYASLGIPEYFIYDRAQENIRGYRLPAAGASRYQRIVPQHGRHASSVLGLDLIVQGNKLRFLYGSSELFGSANLIGRLEGMVESLTTKADEAELQAEQAAARAERAEAQNEEALAGLREAIFSLLAARGISCPGETRDRVRSCVDVPVLQRWLLRATTAGSAEEVFAVEAPPSA
jgi:Uma2 family endonuclease